jgi:hypothetical protein
MSPHDPFQIFKLRRADVLILKGVAYRRVTSSCEHGHARQATPIFIQLPDKLHGLSLAMLVEGCTLSRPSRSGLLQEGVWWLLSLYGLAEIAPNEATWLPLSAGVAKTPRLSSHVDVRMVEGDWRTSAPRSARP